MTGKSEQWNAMRILGERVSPSKITSLGISASRLLLSHTLGEKIRCDAGGLEQEIGGKIKKEDGENLTLVLFSRGLRLKRSLAQNSLPAFDPW
jgi:hypothetical protein